MSDSKSSTSLLHNQDSKLPNICKQNKQRGMCPNFSTTCLYMFQWLNHPFGSIKIKHFFQKENKKEIKTFHICDIFGRKKINNETKCCVVEWTWGALVAGRVPVAWGDLWTTWDLLTPSPLPSQHTHKTIVCFQIKIMADVWQLWRIGRCNRCTGTSLPLFGLLLGATSAMEPRHKEETADPFRRHP